MHITSLAPGVVGNIEPCLHLNHAITAFVASRPGALFRLWTSSSGMKCRPWRYREPATLGIE